MKHRLLTGVWLAWISLVFGVLYNSQNVQAIQVITPTPVNSDDLRVFPGDLVCGEIEELYNGDGPVWMSITIGQSALSEVEKLLSTFSDNNYVFFDDDNYNTRFINPNFLQETEFPSSVRVCLHNNIVQVIAVGYNPPLSIPRPNLDDLVAQFGLPDEVTWTDNPASRVVFWFEQGIAVVVTVIPNEEESDLRGQSTFGRVVEEIYFPYQEGENYENRWPYNQTRKFNRFLPSPQDTSVDYGPENPFDFETIIARIAAEPAQITSPTLISRE